MDYFFLKNGLTLANFISFGTIAEVIDLLIMKKNGVLRNSAASVIKESKGAKIRNRYNQVPQPNQTSYGRDSPT